MVESVKRGVYEEACTEARRWIEAATSITFPCDDFRQSLRDGILLCKLLENMSGINVGQLNPIPRSLAWMDNLVIFLNICRYMGLQKSQLFRVDDLAAVRNQEIPLKIKQKEEDRRLRNVLITIFWLGRVAYSLEDYQGPLPELDAFEALINKNRPPEMVDQLRNKFELDTISGSGTWPKISRASRSRDSNVREGSLEYFENMRRQLIPRLTANVKERAHVYERIQDGAKQSEEYGGGRLRSLTNPKADELPGKPARKAQSFGVLNTKRNHTPIDGNNVPAFHTGSITRRTPVKVNQSHAQKETKPYSHGYPVKIDRPERSFRYDFQPVVKGQTPFASHSTVNSSKSKGRNDDFVSVKAMIKQWSGSDAKRVIQSEANHGEKYKNRRSLQANIDSTDILLSERKELPHSKSVAENMYNQKQKEYISTSNWSLPDASLPSERNRGKTDETQNYSTENRTNVRRKSEPSNYFSKQHDATFTVRNRASSMKEKEYYHRHHSKDSARETVVKSETTDDTYAAVPYSQPQYQKEVTRGTRNEKYISKHPVSNTARRSLPLAQKAEVKHIENYMDKKLYQPKNSSSVDRRKLESIGKYATMPARHMRVNHDQLIVGKNECVGKVEDVNWDERHRRGDKKYEKASDNKHPLKTSASLRSPSSHRRLPTYEEAIVPLEESDLVNVERKTETANTKVVQKEHVSVAPVQKRFVENKVNVSTAKELDFSIRKQPVNENVSKQNVAHERAAREVEPVVIAKEAPRKNKMIQNETKRRHHDVLPMKQTIASTSKSSRMSEFDFRKATSDRTRLQDTNISYIDDVNNNQLPVYDGEALKTLLTSQQRSSRNSSNKNCVDKERTSKTKDSFDGKGIKSEKEVARSEYESIREEQKTILGEDFQHRARSRMDPSVAQQFTTEGGVSSPNVVHESELLGLVAAEEKYWKEKVEKKEKSAKQKEMKKIGSTNDKQERVNEMLREFKMNDQREKIDYSEITDTLRAEEEYLAQEAEKLLKQRFQEKSLTPAMTARKDSQFNVKQQSDDADKTSLENSRLHSILKTSSRQKKTPSVTSSDDINLKPEADQAYHHHPRRILRSRSPVYICSGCRLPVEKDICLYVAELQSYWHEKCFRCSVCHSNLIQGEQTPRIRVMFSRIHCENCLSNKKTGGQSTMV